MNQSKENQQEAFSSAFIGDQSGSHSDKLT
jgi:hypothetical protein